MEKITANYRVDGKDFVYQGFDGSGYCSMRDFASGVKVNIRYDRLLKVTTVTVP